MAKDFRGYELHVGDAVVYSYCSGWIGGETRLATGIISEIHEDGYVVINCELNPVDCKSVCVLSRASDGEK